MCVCVCVCVCVHSCDGKSPIQEEGTDFVLWSEVYLMGQRLSIFTVLALHRHKVKLYTKTYSPYAATEAVVTTPSILHKHMRNAYTTAA